MQSSQERTEIERFTRHLQFWQHRCPACESIETTDDMRVTSHSLTQCVSDEVSTMQELEKQIASKIRYERYSCCYHCGLPQGICRRYEIKSEKECKGNHHNKSV